jgi:hypothetical protein
VGPLVWCWEALGSIYWVHKYDWMNNQLFLLCYIVSLYFEEDLFIMLHSVN